MNQHMNHLVAQSAARERERDLQVRLRQQEAAARRPPVVEPPVVVEAPRHPWLQGALVRLHVARA